jgi:ribosome-binding protein aMBF1 (putative translation factor)
MSLTIHGEYMTNDFVREVIEERSARNPRFRQLVSEADERRRVAKRLAAARRRRRLSQTVIAALMGTSASVISKLEAGGDVKVSTLQRYALAIGERSCFRF